LTFPGTLASDKDRDSTLRTFRGSRMCRGDKIVNESVTMTIDPLNLTCLTCDREHKIGDKPGPTVVFLGDQNMDPIMTGGCTDESSVVTIRMENSSLAELTDLCLEIFEGKGVLKPGSLVLASSLSHLIANGSGKYSKDWCLTVNRLEKKLPGTRVCPIPPVLKENAEGSVAFDLMTLGYWFSKVYAGNPNGLIDTWSRLVATVTTCMIGHVPLPHPLCLKIEFPASLQFPIGSTVVTAFSFNSSSPAMVLSPTRAAIDELMVSGLRRARPGLRSLPESGGRLPKDCPEHRRSRP